MPERDDRRREPDADTLGARRKVGGHDQRIGQHLPAPDAEVVLGEPEVVEAGLLAEPRELAYLVEDIAIVAFVSDVPGIAEVAELHDVASGGRIDVRGEDDRTMLRDGRIVKEAGTRASDQRSRERRPGYRGGCTSHCAARAQGRQWLVPWRNAMTPDLIIRGGLVFDGTGAAPSRADVAVHEGCIAHVGEIDTEASVELDAPRPSTWRPAFIDVHSHSDYTLLVDPESGQRHPPGGDHGGDRQLRSRLLPDPGSRAVEPHRLRVRRHRVPWTGPRRPPYLERLEQCRARRQRHDSGAQWPASPGHRGARLAPRERRRGRGDDPAARGGDGSGRLGATPRASSTRPSRGPGSRRSRRWPGPPPGGAASTPPTPGSASSSPTRAVAEAIRTARNAGVKLQGLPSGAP